MKYVCIACANQHCTWCCWHSSKQAATCSSFLEFMIQASVSQTAVLGPPASESQGPLWKMQIPWPSHCDLNLWGWVPGIYILNQLSCDRQTQLEWECLVQIITCLNYNQEKEGFWRQAKGKWAKHVPRRKRKFFEEGRISTLVAVVNRQCRITSKP